MSTNGSARGPEKRPDQATQLVLALPNEDGLKMHVSHIDKDPRPTTNATVSHITSLYTTTTTTLDPVVVSVASGSRGGLTLDPTSVTDHIYGGYPFDATSEGSRPKRRSRRVQSSYFESRRSEYRDSTQNATPLDHSPDLNEFFEEPELNTIGNTTRKCKLCWKHGTLRVLVEDVGTTFRRHLEAFHESSYNKWANMNRFVSKLPGAVKRRKDAQTEYVRSRQASPDLEVAAEHSSDAVVPYNDGLSRKTVMRWLMETNPTIDHPRFKGILVLSTRSTRCVVTPRRTPRSRVKGFKDNLVKLWTRSKKKTTSQG